MLALPQRSRKDETMAIFDLGKFNPIFADSQGGGVIDISKLPGNRGKLVIYNDSAVSIQLYTGNHTKRVLAGMVDGFDLMAILEPIDTLRWRQDVILSNAGQAPLSVIAIDGYTPDENVGMRLPMAIPRLANVGNTVPVTGNAQVLFNDGQPPATLFVEATPLDQVSTSAVQWFNDGSMLLKILSAGAQRTAIQVIRGDFGTTAAQIIFGDPTDNTITILHGTADNATQAGQAQTAITAQQANTVLMFDGGLSVINSVACYEGTVDPSTYVVPNFGDLWFDG